jgi:hypothetical protein
MDTYSDVALCINPTSLDKEVTEAYETWMLLNRARIVALITATGLKIIPNAKVDILASDMLKWHGEHVDALMEVLNGELMDIPFLSWEMTEMYLREGAWARRTQTNISDGDVDHGSI